MMVSGGKAWKKRKGGWMESEGKNGEGGKENEEWRMTEKEERRMGSGLKTVHEERTMLSRGKTKETRLGSEREDDEGGKDDDVWREGVEGRERKMEYERENREWKYGRLMRKGEWGVE